MKEAIREQVRKATTLAEVGEGLLKVLAQRKPVGYVAGIITSDGPEHINDNIRRLGEWTERIREREGKPTFYQYKRICPAAGQLVDFLERSFGIGICIRYLHDSKMAGIYRGQR